MMIPGLLHRRFANLAGLALVATLTAAPGNAEVLARWRGGELTAEVFRERYDRDGEARRRGGDVFMVRICKASYAEVYHSLALAAGLDLDAEHMAEVASWRERRLAEFYRQRNFPEPSAEIGVVAARAEYERRPERYTMSAEADLEVLFVRCDRDREACRDRMRELRQRFSDGLEFAAILAEERVRSGEANGTFRDVALSNLAVELQDAVLETAPGSFTDVIETPIGLFWARVLRREDSQLLPFAQVEKRIRRRLGREFFERWQAEELARLRCRFGAAVGEDAGSESLFAAAARAEGLDRDPAFMVQAEDMVRFKLADRAFYRDTEILPTDEELALQLAEPKTASRYRRLRLLLAVTAVGDDHWEALRIARNAAAELAAAPDPGSFMRRLPERVPRFHLEQMGPLTLRELGHRHPRLREIVAELESGQWRGPVTYRDGPEAGDGEPNAFALLLLEELRPASLVEVRGALLRDFRGSLGASKKVFFETFGRRWEFEVLVSLEPGRDRPTPAAEETSGTRQ